MPDKLEFSNANRSVFRISHKVKFSQQIFLCLSIDCQFEALVKGVRAVFSTTGANPLKIKNLNIEIDIGSILV